MNSYENAEPYWIAGNILSTPAWRNHDGLNDTDYSHPVPFE